jgi:gliding motility-associated-like protein
MKKITVLIIMFLFSFSGYSQFSEGFESANLPDYTTDTWNLGSTGLGSNGIWGVFDNGVGLSQSWKTVTGSTPPPLVYEGLQAAYKDRENNGPAGSMSRDYLATPLVTIPTNGELRFWTRSGINGDTGALYKIMVAPATAVQNDPAAYTQIQQWTENQLTTTFSIYQEKVVGLSAFAGQQIYVAFVLEYTQPTTALSGDRWLVDKVRIVEKCLPPTTLTAGTITQTSATLSWANPSGATQWEIAIQPFSATPTTPASGVVITSNPYVATATTNPVGPLAPTTQYQYWVRALCGSDPNTVGSEWVGPFAFITSSPGLTCASPITIPPGVPYSTTDNTGNYDDTTDVHQPNACAGGTTNYMTGNDVFYSYTPTVTGAISIEMTPTANYSGIFVYQGCANVGVNCVAGVANSGNGIRTIPSLNVTAGMTYIIVISTNNAPQTTDYTLTIQTLNCPSPTALSATPISTSSANLSWQNATSTSWEVFVQTAGASIPTTAGQTANTNTGFTVTNLTGGAALAPGISYQYWVRGDCGNGTFSAWSGPFAFNTLLCTTGCSYNFVMTDSNGNGWQNNTMTIKQGTVVVATLTGPTAAQGTAPITVSVPMCDGPFTLTWNAGGTAPGQVGISIVNSFGQTIYTKPAGTGAQNTTLFTGTINCSAPLCLPPTNLTVATPTTSGATLNWTPHGTPDSWLIYAVTTGSPAPTAATVPTLVIPGTTTLPYVLTGLLADTAYTYYVSAACTGTVTPTSTWSAASASFTTLATCPKPTAVTLTVATVDSFNLNWANGAAETAWEYLVLPASDPAPTAATTGWISTTAHPLTVNGLNSATTYKAYVRAVCSSTDKSTIASSANATTLICSAANQCLYTFTVVDGYGDGWNGGTMIVVQNGITVATLTGPTNAQNQTPINVQVPICTGIPFNLIWNNEGSFYYEMGITITSPFGEVLFIKPTYASEAASPPYPGSTTPIYSANGNCTPPTCPKPVALTATNPTETSVVLGWTESGTATVWEIVIVDTGAPAPGANPTGIITANVNPILITGLLSGHAYSYYVRAACSSTDKSYWSGPINFKTLPANDNCAGAIAVPVNSNSSCNQIVSGTVAGATASGTPALAPCVGNANDDVWFQFVASNSYLNFSLLNVQGSTTNLNYAIYSGTCGALTHFYCSPSNELTSVLNNLVVGQTYYIRVYSNSAAAQTTTFDICITTPSTCSNSPTICNTTYTNTVGVTSLGEIGCLYSSPNPSFFTIQILNSGPVNYTLTQSSVGSATPDLDVDYAAWGPFTSQSAACTVISSNGAPLTGLTTGCSYSAAPTETFNIPNAQAGQFYVILITNYSDDPGVISLTQTNANAPGAGQTFCCSDPNFSYPQSSYCTTSGLTPIPVLAFNSIAGVFSSSPGLVFANTATGEINLAASTPGIYVISNTIAATASCPERHYDFTITIAAPVVATLAYSAPSYCSNNTTLQNVTLTGTAGGSYSVTPPGLFINTTTGAINPSLSAAGNYTVYYNLGSAGVCGSSQPSTQVEIIATPVIAQPAPVNVCGSYTLPALTLGNYFTASGGGGTPLFAGDVINSTQTIYVYVADGACSDEKSFLVTVNQTPSIQPIANVATCSPYNLPVLAVGNYYTGPGGTGTMLNGNAVISTDQTLYVYAANGTCTSEESFTITFGVLAVTTPGDQIVCDSYILPSLAVGNYYTGSGATGTSLAVGSTVSTTQTIYVYGQQGTCTDEDSFLVTVNQTPVISPVSNVSSCGCYTLPSLATGNYFTATGGAGTPLNSGDTVCTDQTIYVYAQTGTTPNCFAEQSFTVTIATIPVVAPVSAVSQCESYTLPALTVGNYFTGPGGTGTPLFAGNVITTSQTIYVYAHSGTTPDCEAEQSFAVNIGTMPSFKIEGGCQGAMYVLDITALDGSFDPQAATYSWTAGTGGEIIGSSNTQSVTVSGVATYSVTVTSNGCSQTLPFIADNTTCTIQKGISPNGDGLNDFFDLAGQNVSQLEIFNRYGTAVYKKRNYSNQWYGQSDNGDELPDGTYYFVIDRASGESKTGWIYINRERN